MNNPLVSIIIPSRDRPLGLLRVIVSILMTTKNHDVEIIPVLDAPDTTSRELILSLPLLDAAVMPDTYVDGHPQQKYQRGYDVARGSWIVTAADDIVFHVGWLSATLAHPNRGLVGLFDPHHKMNMATLYAVTRDYVERVMSGYLGLPWYRVWAADREWMERAKRAAAFTICPEAGFEHFHPCLGTAQPDRISRMSTQWHKQDDLTYKARLEADFPDEWPEA